MTRRADLLAQLKAELNMGWRTVTPPTKVMQEKRWIPGDVVADLGLDLTAPRCLSWIELERYILWASRDDLHPDAELGAHQFETSRIARRLHIDRRNVIRHRTEGALTVDQADAYATRLNIHPSQIWPNWHRVC